MSNTLTTACHPQVDIRPKLPGNQVTQGAKILKKIEFSIFAEVSKVFSYFFHVILYHIPATKHHVTMPMRFKQTHTHAHTSTHKHMHTHAHTHTHTHTETDTHSHTHAYTFYKQGYFKNFLKHKNVPVVQYVCHIRHFNQV